MVLCLSYSSILNYDAVPPKASDATQRPTRRYIPEDTTHNCDNLESYNFYCYKIIINGQIGGSEQTHPLDLMENKTAVPKRQLLCKRDPVYIGRCFKIIVSQGYGRQNYGCIHL
jgi:hypothetical protein